MTGSKEFLVYAEVFIRGVLVERFVYIGASTRDVYKEIFICIELIPSAEVIRSNVGLKTLVTTFNARDEKRASSSSLDWSYSSSKNCFKRTLK